MPIIYTFNNGPQQNMSGLLWIYQNDENTEEILDTITNNNNVSYLKISSETHIKPCLPSLEIFNTGHLISLKIIGMDITNMSPIPSSVRELELNDTNISDLNIIPVNWSNIRDISLSYNRNLDGRPLIFPHYMILDQLIINFQRFTLIRLPQSSQSVFLRFCRYHQITGFLPSTTFVNYTAHGFFGTDSIYDFEMIPRNIYFHDPANIMRNDYFTTIANKVHSLTNQHIKDMNDNVNHKLCNEFSHIPKRIKNAYEHRDEPIVSALHLASNVPRRMAEFVMEFTIMCF